MLASLNDEYEFVRQENDGLAEHSRGRTARAKALGPSAAGETQYDRQMQGDGQKGATDPNAKSPVDQAKTSAGKKEA